MRARQTTLPGFGPVRRRRGRRRRDPHPIELEHPDLSRVEFLRLRAASVLAGTFEPVPGLPGATRASCPPDRAEVGCPYVRCRHHLWAIHGGPDGERAGRPGLSACPRDARGWTLRAPGELPSSTRPASTLAPRWLEHPLPASCALDLAERGAMGNQAIGDALGRHRTLAARLVERATAQAIESAGDLGLAPGDLLAGLRESGER